jgi:trehalose-6-phosphate synthase
MIKDVEHFFRYFSAKLSMMLQGFLSQKNKKRKTKPKNKKQKNKQKNHRKIFLLIQRLKYTENIRHKSPQSSRLHPKIATKLRIIVHVYSKWMIVTLSSDPLQIL